VSDRKKESVTPSSEISLTLIHFKVHFTKDLTEVYVYLTAVHTFFPKIMEQPQNSKRHSWWLEASSMLGTAQEVVDRRSCILAPGIW